MEWLSTKVLGAMRQGPDKAAPPPCLTILASGDIVVSDAHEHVQCLLDWKAREASHAQLAQQQSVMSYEDVVSFEEDGSRPGTGEIGGGSSLRRHELLLVLVNIPILDINNLIPTNQELGVTALYCAKSRFPCLPLQSFVALLQAIVEWRAVRPRGVVAFASDKAASKQLLLYAAMEMVLHPSMGFAEIDRSLQLASEQHKAQCAKNYSFVVRPSHPAPSLSLETTLFPSQKRLLQHWKNWVDRERECAQRGLPLPQPPRSLRLVHIALSIAAREGSLLSSLGDNHPTVELWLSHTTVISSRPQLTLQQLKEDAAEASVQSLELINSVIRMQEKSSYFWECGLDTLSTKGDLLVRIFTSEAMFRVQLHAHLLAPLSAPEELVTFEDDEVDGYDLAVSREGHPFKLRVSLTIEKGEDAHDALSRSYPAGVRTLLASATPVSRT